MIKRKFLYLKLILHFFYLLKILTIEHWLAKSSTTQRANRHPFINKQRRVIQRYPFLLPLLNSLYRWLHTFDIVLGAASSGLQSTLSDILRLASRESRAVCCHCAWTRHGRERHGSCRAQRTRIRGVCDSTMHEKIIARVERRYIDFGTWSITACHGVVVHVGVRAGDSGHGLLRVFQFNYTCRNISIHFIEYLFSRSLWDYSKVRNKSLIWKKKRTS